MGRKHLKRKRTVHTYSPLSPGVGKIRLLRLLPDNDKDAIVRCRLFEYALTQTHKNQHENHLYEALSYVWGNAKETRSILIDDQSFKVTTNLHSALLRLRNHSIERLLWIDAICINQDDLKEKGQQIQSMANIYSQANCVIVWLGEVANDSDRALKAIRIARSTVSLDPLDEDGVDNAVLALLQRPWFRRIWILQEVAAARSVVIICGSTEVNGYTFCLGVDSLLARYDSLPELQNSIRSVIYLIRGAISRPKGPDMISGETHSLGELVDMYHTHEATVQHDKVYALLGMTFDSLSRIRFLPAYEGTWKTLFEILTKYLLSEELSVEISHCEKIAVIKGECVIIGHIISAKGYINSDGRQIVRVSWRDILSKQGHPVEWNEEWTLRPSAKSIVTGDIICLFRGASRPTIIRMHNDHWAVILIAATPPETLETIQTGCEVVEWSESLQLFKPLRNRYIQCTWNWEISPKTPQGKAECLELVDYPDTNHHAWTCALALADVKQYKKAELRFQEAFGNFEEGSETKLMVDKTARLLSVAEDADIDLMNRKYSQPPLWWALQVGHKALVECLMRMNKDYIDLRNGPGRTSLHEAAGVGHLAVVERLLQEKAEVNAVADFGIERTALQAASKGGHLAVVERLLQEKVDVNANSAPFGRTALQAAAEGGHITVVERLLQSGAQVNAKPAESGGKTALQAAAEGGHLAVVERLLQAKAEVNAVATECGKTALQAAAGRGNLAVVERLLQEKADVNAVAGDHNGRTALQAAAEGGHLAVVERLLQAKADVNAAAAVKWGKTALQAAAGGHLAVVVRLLQAKANVNAAAARYGTTALEAAARGGNFAVVERLLQEKAEVNAAALEAAAKGGHIAIVKRLLQEKAVVNMIAGYAGSTALEAAAEYGHIAIVEMLQEAIDTR